MLATGRYYGIASGDGLVCVAGVHVYAPSVRVAALGNVTTDPRLRGRGLARRTTARLCRALVDDGIVDIGLNVLAANAEWLKENKRAHTEIEGHCDERGTVEYNLALGAKRAKAVKDYLVSLGVATDRLTTISYGEELPLCRDASEQCYARNRRVHFVPPSE